MQRILLIATIAFLALLTSSCTGSKSFYKKGQKLEKNGLTIEATNFYIESLKRKRSNEDAIIALKKLGQQVLDDKYTTFYKHYSGEEFKEAVYAYLDADAFKSNAMAVGVVLKEAPYYKDYYDEAKNIYIAELYDQAQKNLDSEDFKNADNLLNEIKFLEPSYKNVESLSNFAFVEPKYRQALHAYDNEEYRQAYYLFEEINKRVKSGYKESMAYQELAKESAQFTIGILPFENKTGVNSLESGISANIITQIKNQGDPFIKLIDRTQTDKVVEEQIYNMSEMIDQSFVIETGSALGTKAILVGKIISASKDEGQHKREKKTGWLGKEIKYFDPVTGTKKVKVVYSKVYYTEHVQESAVKCTFQYQLISTSTGEVLVSDIIETVKSDKVDYATFNGDSRLLVPGYWKDQNRKDPSDRIYDSYSYKRALDAKLSASRNLKSIIELTNDVYDLIGEKVAAKISSFNPEL